MPSSNEGFETQRALGRIEGAQAQILKQLVTIEEKLGQHINDDQVALSSMRLNIGEYRNAIATQFEEQAKDRNRRLDAQDEQLEEIARYISWAKGVSWPLMGGLGIISAVLVAVLIAQAQMLFGLKG